MVGQTSDGSFLHLRLLPSEKQRSFRLTFPETRFQPLFSTMVQPEEQALAVKTHVGDGLDSGSLCTSTPGINVALR